MALPVVTGAKLMCTMGTAPGSLTVIPSSMVNMEGKPAATIMDFAPMANISSFGNCITPSNPQVAAATAAALGVLTPMPCVPVTVAPWAPGCPTVTVGKMPALNNSSKCMCAWGGAISITDPGATKETIP